MLERYNKKLFYISLDEDAILFSKFSMKPIVLKKFKGTLKDYYTKTNNTIFKENGIIKNITKNPLKKNKLLNQIGFNSTDSCNLKCKYCLKHEKNNNSKAIPDEIKKSIKKILSLFSDCKNDIKVEISGGEPFLALKEINIFSELLKNEIKEKFKKKVNIQYNIITNGTILNKEIITFLKNQDVDLGISLDCSKVAHDKNRITIKNNGTFDIILKNIKILNSQNIKIQSLMITVNNSNIDCFDIKELKKIMNDYNIETVTFQIDKNWERTGFDLLKKFKNIMNECKQINIKYAAEAFDVLFNFIDYQNGLYNLFTNSCGFYRKDFFTINYDGKIKKCPYVNNFISKREIKKQQKKCKKCFIESLCSGKCMTVEEDTDCYFRKILFESLLISKKSSFPILDRKM